VDGVAVPQTKHKNRWQELKGLPDTYPLRGVNVDYLIGQPCVMRRRFCAVLFVGRLP
jgi:hypothetical protein